MLTRLLQSSREWTSGKKQIDIIIAGSLSKEQEQGILWRQICLPFNLSLSSIRFYTSCGVQTSQSIEIPRNANLRSVSVWCTKRLRKKKKRCPLGICKLIYFYNLKIPASGLNAKRLTHVYYACMSICLYSLWLLKICSMSLFIPYLLYMMFH